MGTAWQHKIWRSKMPGNNIRHLIKNLGDSINDTPADSPKINERIQEIRASGYEVVIIIEAKIEFNREGKGENEVASSNEPVRLRITQEDAKFLKSLKISSYEA
jgi:hypothetical protein